MALLFYIAPGYLPLAGMPALFQWKVDRTWRIPFALVNYRVRKIADCFENPVRQGAPYKK
ncbi:hypothetical protein [Cardiobacterium hominis]|uniref:hypothetical protein n=1 Tax=Cardiobacterium hominis TaxID=2718 RepID=UPI0028E96AB3|nr:hypothetical protein [Cardiobacterium hominis]